jgi:hypothetical protein
VKAWIYGLLCSLVIGGIVIELFYCIMRLYLDIGQKEPDVTKVPSWLTGVVERLFFTILVGNEMDGTAPAMMAWLGIKMLTNWNRDDWKGNQQVRAGAFIALLTGLVSMLFAVFGGLIWQRLSSDV